MKIYSVDVFTKIPIAVFIEDDATDQEICEAAAMEAKDMYDIERMEIFNIDNKKFYEAFKKLETKAERRFN